MFVWLEIHVHKKNYSTEMICKLKNDIARRVHLRAYYAFSPEYHHIITHIHETPLYCFGNQYPT